MNKKNRGAAATTAIFIAMLGILSLSNLLLPSKEFSPMENRALTPFPSISTKGIQSGAWMNTFETYASDQFLFRDGFVKIKTAADLALQRKDNSLVYFGEDGYLFSIETLDEKQEKANLLQTANWMNRLTKQHPTIHTCVLLAPTARWVLADKLPPHAPVPDEQSAMDLASAFLKQQAPSTVFTNPYTTLFHAAAAASSNADDRPLYYKTDHHWTTDGAYLAYCQWAAENGFSPFLQENFRIETVFDHFLGTNQSKAPGIPTEGDHLIRYVPTWDPPYQVYRWKNTTSPALVGTSMYDDNFLAGKDQYGYFLGGNDPQVRIKTNVKNGRSLLLIKDSYANCMVPFLALHFEEIHITDLRYSHGKMQWPTDTAPITDVLLLYNIQSFSSDRNLAYLTQLVLP